jgi:protein gp37
MGRESAISWTHATWNAWWGCTKVSPACDGCYAESWAERTGYSGTGSHFPIWGKDAGRRFFGDKHWNEPVIWDRQCKKLGVKSRVFCGSMCDVMEDRDDLKPHRERLYELIEKTPNLVWLLLTKRPHNFKRFLPIEWLENPRPNVIGMTTVESADYVWRIKSLCDTPFAFYGLSMEPLFSYVMLPDYFLKLGARAWTITGGESGKNARPGHPDWYRSLRDQSVAAGVPFHFKQHGEWMPRGPESLGYPIVEGVPTIRLTDTGDDGSALGSTGTNDTWMQRVGKKQAGRLLDGKLWEQVPSV